MIKKPIEITKKSIDIQDSSDKLFRELRLVTGRDSNLLVGTIPPTATSFLQDVANDWFETRTVVNYTINPDPKHLTKYTVKGGYKAFWQLSQEQIYNLCKAEIKKLLSKSKEVKMQLAGFYLCFEFGDKNGKFHCNLTTAWCKDTDERTYKYFIKNKLNEIFGKGHHAIKVTEHSKYMTKPDTYMHKDASYMTNLGYKPFYCTNKTITKTLMEKNL